MKFEVESEPNDGIYFHQSMASAGGEEEGFTADITTTIGLGGTKILLRVEKEDGTVVKESIELKDMLSDWIGSILDGHQTSNCNA